MDDEIRAIVQEAEQLTMPIVRASVALFDCLSEFPDMDYCHDHRQAWGAAVIAYKREKDEATR
jgi:hypothetical protein